ncbi:MAG: DUF4345 domain-containing protein [Planctomycetota bacterium]
MKRSLQITMLVVAAIPLMLGLLGFILGAGQFVPKDQITANLDSHIRFSAIWFTGAFFLTVWCVRNLEIAGPVMRILFVVMAFGGAARLFSMSQFGIPDPPMIGGAIVEIAVLAFIPWHAVVMRHTQTETPT